MKPLAAILLALFVCTQPGRADDTTLPYKYVGNNFTHKFHKPSCEFARRIWTTRVQLFHFRKDAVAAEYKPCNWCLPQRWWQCHGKLLNAAAQVKSQSPPPPAPAQSAQGCTPQSGLGTVSSTNLQTPPDAVPRK